MNMFFTAATLDTPVEMRNGTPDYEFFQDSCKTTISKMGQIFKRNSSNA